MFWTLWAAENSEYNYLIRYPESVCVCLACIVICSFIQAECSRQKCVDNRIIEEVKGSFSKHN